MHSFLLLAALTFSDTSYGPPQTQWITITDPTWFGQLHGSLQYYTVTNKWVRIQCTTSYVQAPPLPPVTIYTVYNFSFTQSAVTSFWAGGNNLLVSTNRGDIVFVDGFEVGQNEP